MALFLCAPFSTHLLFFQVDGICPSDGQEFESDQRPRNLSRPKPHKHNVPVTSAQQQKTKAILDPFGDFKIADERTPYAVFSMRFSGGVTARLGNRPRAPVPAPAFFREKRACVWKTTSPYFCRLVGTRSLGLAVTWKQVR